MAKIKTSAEPLQAMGTDREARVDILKNCFGD